MALSVHLREQVFSLARKTLVRAPVSHTGTPGFSVQPRLPTPASRSRRPWETAVMVPVLGFLPLMGGLGCVPRAEDGPHRYKHLVHQGVGALLRASPTRALPPREEIKVVDGHRVDSIPATPLPGRRPVTCTPGGGTWCPSAWVRATGWES